MALDFAVGCLGGFTGTFVGHPFDTVKVRLQNQSSVHKKYSGTWGCVTQIIKTESFFGLYKGILSPLYGQIGMNAIIFGVHGNVLRVLGNHDVRGQFIAGCIAGGVQSIVASPIELVKIRFQMQGEGMSSSAVLTKVDKRYYYKSLTDCLYKIYKYEGGIRGVSRGMTLTLVREIPSFGTYFASYHYLCAKTKAISDEGVVNVWKLLFCGGTAGILCWIVTYPMDVIKTRQQMDGMGVTNYKGIIDCTFKSVREEGLSVFGRGLNVTLLRAFPTNAATLATVTVALNLLECG